MTRTIKCPDCKEEVPVKDAVETGEVLECLNCGAEMEVININPVEVSLIEEEK